MLHSDQAEQRQHLRPDKSDLVPDFPICTTTKPGWRVQLNDNHTVVTEVTNESPTQHYKAGVASLQTVTETVNIGPVTYQPNVRQSFTTHSRTHLSVCIKQLRKTI
jgi:hypothetical protein